MTYAGTPSGPAGGSPRAEVRLGLGANLAQFGLLVLVNAFVGAMVGLERSILGPERVRRWARTRAVDQAGLSQGQVFLQTSFTDRELSSVSQAGLVNNLNDGMAWGLLPLFFAAAGMSLEGIGWLAAIYPGVWGVGQLVTGALSDRIGRKWLIAGGMWVQAAGIAVIVLSSRFAGFAAGAVLLGAGTAMVYPTLLAAIGDVAHPAWRASVVALRMRETQPRERRARSPMRGEAVPSDPARTALAPR